MRPAVSRRVPLALLIAAACAACDVSVGQLTARATDEWTHHYSLSPGGEIRIVNTNGRVEVEGTSASGVEVRAERIARAATETGARELLPRIVIREDVQPGRVTLETERMAGFMIGAAVEVRYHVRAPKQVVVNVANTNGAVTLTDLGGKAIVRTTNGAISAKNITGALEARSTNGGVNAEFASLGADAISMQTTNGALTIIVPDDAKANLSASWTNGGINIAPGLKLEVSEQSRRKFEGRLNGGGTAIQLRTTNGGIRIRERGQS